MLLDTGKSPATLTLPDDSDDQLLEFNISIIACDWDTSNELEEMHSKNKVLK